LGAPGAVETGSQKNIVVLHICGLCLLNFSVLNVAEVTLSSFQPRLFPRLSVLAAALLLLCCGGCKTQKDAAAAASQMASTAQTLSSYYAALDHVLAETQLVYQARSELDNVTPLDLSDTRQQIQLREDLATEIGNVASLFQKLTGSSAASDASAAAGKLNSEMVSIKALASNDNETKAVTLGIQSIVTLIQQHEEIKAAQQIQPLCHNLSVFFDSESRFYNSIDQAYLTAASAVSKLLLDKNYVDVSPVFLAALQPFNLSPSINGYSLSPQMRAFLTKQVDDGSKTGVASCEKATDALSAALKEMDARFTLVAQGKVLHITMPPLSLSTVENWIKQVAG
jgi:hypothetical protein